MWYFKYTLLFLFFGQKIVCTERAFFLILPIAQSAKDVSVFGLGKHKNKTATHSIC